MDQAVAWRPTLSDVLFPDRGMARSAALVISLAFSVAVSARVSVPLPFTPVPITGQTFAVLLTGLLLGARLGAGTLALYLMAGVVGLPVFAASPALPPGLARILGPTGGYLLAYPLAAGMVGWLAERGWDRRVGTALGAAAIGNGIIYVIGVPYLALIAHLGLPSAARLGFLPFILGDLFKLGLLALLLPTAWRFCGGRQAKPTDQTSSLRG